jgi:hypothetical protein
MKIDFEHQPAAHCECGVTSNILRYYGIRLSEPMILGLGSGLFFSYMPFITLHGMPVVSFRPLPGRIFTRVTQRLRVKTCTRYYPLRENRAMQQLDRLLSRGTPAGVVVGVYQLPYFPKEYRFHFNAHNLCVIGKEDDRYTVSDPVSTVLHQLNPAELQRVRYAKGTYPPLGKMYWIRKKPRRPADLRTAILRSIRLNCNRMLDIPIPYFGARGIVTMANKMRTWEARFGARKAALHLAQTIRMLEEIGTGGAGFRYMYAAFLQEAAEHIGHDALRDFSQQMTQIGDLWRNFAHEAGRKFKKRGADVCSYDQLADKLFHIAGEEKRFFTQLRNALPSL